MLSNVSLPGLRVFETVARRGSFKAAAAELNLSASAVSHAITNLERAMGVALFEREERPVRLTVSGEVFMRHVSAAFDELRRGLDVVAGQQGRQVLRLHSAPSFASTWLSPRLPRFLSEHPGIEVRLSASTEYCRFDTDDFDADIVYGPVRASGVEAIPIAEETVTPLCAPSLAERIRVPADLAALNLILSDNKQVRWLHWFEANGLRIAAQHSIRFDRSSLALAAAADGLGVALESTLLAERDLATGRLVAPLAARSVDLTYVGHHLVFPRETRRRPSVRSFIDWLHREVPEKQAG